MERVEESVMAPSEDATPDASFFEAGEEGNDGSKDILDADKERNDGSKNILDVRKEGDAASKDILDVGKEGNAPVAEKTDADKDANSPGEESNAVSAEVQTPPHPATFTRPLCELQARLGAPVSDELLFLAMTHPSAVGEGIERTLLSNQRLEFLGDSLVGAICAEYFFRSEPQSPEGALTNRKISAVRKDALASAAKRLELGEYLTFGRGEDIAGGRERHSNLSDAFEALIAVIFLSSDWNTTRDWVLLALSEELNKDPATLVPAKNRLQERTQAMGLGIPRYETTQSHPKAQWFGASVFLGDEMRGQGEAKSKKLAEENAAKVALETLNF